MTFWFLQLQDLTTSMLELWNLMDTPIEEQNIFQNVTRKIAAKEHEITEPDMLSVEFIAHVSYRIFEITVTVSFHCCWCFFCLTLKLYFGPYSNVPLTIKVEGEVSRLEELKASKMKELVLKKRSELEEIYRKTHIVADSDSAMSIAIEAIESGI